MRLRSKFLAANLDDAEATCTIWYVRRRLGKPEFKDKRITAYITKLIEQRDFPPPLPDMSSRRRELIEGVTINSRWIRAAIDQWFDDFLPALAVAGLDDAARARAADRMDANAARLGAVRLTGGRQA